jgi:hypothetical protein
MRSEEAGIRMAGVRKCLPGSAGIGAVHLELIATSADTTRPEVIAELQDGERLNREEQVLDFLGHPSLNSTEISRDAPWLQPVIAGETQGDIANCRGRLGQLGK